MVTVAPQNIKHCGTETTTQNIPRPRQRQHRLVSFSTAVTTVPTIARSDFSPQEKQAYWYTSKDFLCMKKKNRIYKRLAYSTVKFRHVKRPIPVKRPIAVIEAAADSAASGHYFPIDFNGGHHDESAPATPVGTANGSNMHSLARDKFSISHQEQQQQHECKKFLEVTLPLISVGRLCLQGYIVVFDETAVYVFTKQGTLIQKGRRDPHRNIYLLQIPTVEPRVLVTSPSAFLAQRNIAANAYELKAVPALISYLHGCAGFIPKDTWIDGINAGYYATWPGLTAARVRRHLQKLEITTLGHMKLVSKRVRSRTTPRKKPRVGVFVVNIDDLEQQIAMDLPGRYPVTSSSGNKYIFLMYDFDSNYIKVLQ